MLAGEKQSSTLKMLFFHLLDSVFISPMENNDHYESAWAKLNVFKNLNHCHYSAVIGVGFVLFMLNFGFFFLFVLQKLFCESVFLLFSSSYVKRN